MRRLKEYVSAGGRLLRCGYTTGTCAAAATYAATTLLLSHTCPPAVTIGTPAGIDVVVDVELAELAGERARCAVRKDAGDDPDVTDGVLVYAEVSRRPEAGVRIEGGLGVGRVTKPGLDQPPGEAAINSTPRSMIERAACDAAHVNGYTGGLTVTISIPAGVALAARTFNPRLGIEGGISVLGTSGIVRPMSEEALVASIRLELSVLQAQGMRRALVVFGNYGRDFARDSLHLGIEAAVTCSNYVGETIDEAARLGFASLLLVGHAGKLVKVAGGAMNTHSRAADGRAETIAAHAALAGAPREAIRDMLAATTTDAMLDILDAYGLREATMRSLMARLAGNLAHRAGSDLTVEAVLFSCRHGLLGKTAGADNLMRRLPQAPGEQSR